MTTKEVDAAVATALDSIKNELAARPMDPREQYAVAQALIAMADKITAGQGKCPSCAGDYHLCSTCTIKLFLAEKGAQYGPLVAGYIKSAFDPWLKAKLEALRGKPAGLYVEAEMVDNRFLARNGMPGAVLYKPGATTAAGGDSS